MRGSNEEEFTAFFENAEPRLRRAFVAAYGPDRGREAAAEALSYAWEHWELVRELDSQIAYLYRVGQSRSRPRRTATEFVRPQEREPWYEPNLAAGLEALTAAQRVAVVLVHGFGWTMREVAECTGVKVTSVQNHLERGLHKLRHALGVSSDVETV